MMLKTNTQETKTHKRWNNRDYIWLSYRTLHFSNCERSTCV